MDRTQTVDALQRKGYAVTCFASKEAAADYLVGAVAGKTVGFGDSGILQSMGMHKRLTGRNTFFSPMLAANNDEFLALASQALNTQIFLTSVNAMTEDGVLVNIDGTGNRVAGSLYRH